MDVQDVYGRMMPVRWMRPCRWAGLLMVAGTAHAQVATTGPVFGQIDVFTARTEGYHHYRVPGITVTPQGTLLVYAEARRGQGDWADIDFVLARSEDGGVSWEERQTVVDADSQTVNNIVGFADRQTGAVLFLYCVDYARCFMIRSDDDGRSFGAPVEVTPALEALRGVYDWTVAAVGPGHGIQLDSGRLLVPVWLAMGDLRPDGSRAHRPSAVSVLTSDDHGVSWQAGGLVVQHGDVVDGEPVVNPSETVAVQLADGRLMVHVRNESERHRRLVAYSEDEGATWGGLYFHDQLLEPVCMGSLVRLSQQPAADRNRLVFANPNNLLRAEERSGPGRDRQNVTVKLSYDEGASWPVARVLEPGPSAYSDLAVGPDGTIYCVYERSGIESAYDPGALTLARFNLTWLTHGADAFPLPENR